MLIQGVFMERQGITRKVVAAANEVHSRRLWTRFTNFDCFAIKAPGLTEPALAAVMGAAGEQYGLSLFRGPQAAASLAAVLEPEGLGDDGLDEMDVLSFNVDPFGSLLPDAQDFLRDAGLHPRYDEQVPSFMVKPPGREPRIPDDSELALLTLILRGIVEVDQKKLLQPGRLGGREGICVLTISGDPDEPQVSVTREKWESPPRPQVGAVPFDSSDLRGLPLFKETWMVGTPPLPPGFLEGDRAAQLLLVADKRSRYVFTARPVVVGDLEEAIHAITGVFRHGPDGRRGLPRQVIFSNRKLYEAMATTLESVGVKCTFTSAIPELQEIADDFLDHLAATSPAFEAGPEDAGEEDLEVPAPDDLKGWKEADRRLSRRFAAYFENEDRLWSERAVKRYFEDDDLEHYLQEHAGQSVIVAYTSWGVLDYRPSKTSKTQAEKMLAEGLPEPQAVLLRARMEASPTLYRVAGHNPKAGTIDLEDVLLGGAVSVYDQLMSENIEDGLFLSARVFAAGQFHFAEPIGPPLGTGMGLEAVEFLKSVRIEFTPEGLRRDAHKFGWMWRWVEEWEAHRVPPRLCNTDGEEFVWHTASFSVAHATDVRAALLRRRDVEYDEAEDEFVWTKQTSRGAKMLGGPVTMGRIELIGDELVLTVNSAQRFAKARRWLEKLPGVAFRTVKTRPWNEDEQDRPMDERMPEPEPVETPPEVIAHVQELMDRHYREWVDMPLPILGNQTPRQACRTPAGRDQVTMLIRTMPDPMGSAALRAPREAMLRELGLAAEPMAAPSASVPAAPASAPAQDVASGRKVARNAPCPCGSGRKYKKCCGRSS